MGRAGNRPVGNGQTSFVRMKKNLYDTSKQISRYRQLNKSGTLANRLNRQLPANTNFPETALREKMASTGLETSTKFKLSNAEQALANINSHQSSQIDGRRGDPAANQVNFRGASDHRSKNLHQLKNNSYSIQNTRRQSNTASNSADYEMHRQKPSTAVPMSSGHRRMIAVP